MNKPLLLQTLKLEWTQVALWIGNLVSSLLGRDLVLQAATDDYDYWAVNCVNDRFQLGDLWQLLAHAHASPKICEAAIPLDATSTPGLDMDLDNLLLQEILHTDWEAQLICPNALYLVGIDPDRLIIPKGEQS